jgi:DNA-binding MltR family transcriptional regulator
MAKNVPDLGPEDLGVEVIEQMDREFHDSPDRVIAIIGGAYLDALLDRLLRAAMVEAPTDVEQLLRPDGAVGSNGARYQLAYCLGLITTDQRDDLKLVAKIRNSFAHNFLALTFGESPIRDYCASLRQPSILAAMPADLFPQQEAELAERYVHGTNVTAREQFRTSVFGLFGSLLRRLAYVRRVTAEGWFSFDPDALTGPSGDPPTV